MSTLKLDELIVGAGLTLKRTATGVYKFFKTSSTNVVNTPIEMNDSGLILDNPLALAEPSLADSSLKLAPTSWINKKIGSYSNNRNRAISTNTVLTANDLGTLLEAGTFNITLPPTTGLQQGASIIISSSPAATPTLLVSPGSGDTIAFNNSGAYTSWLMGKGTDLVLVKDVNIWRGHFGSECLRTSQLFDKSLSVNGYQKLPSGLILQWGLTNNIVGYNNMPYNFGFPMVFPNLCFNVTATAAYDLSISGVYNGGAYISGFSTTGATIGSTAGNVGGPTYYGRWYWTAIGY